MKSIRVFPLLFLALVGLTTTAVWSAVKTYQPDTLIIPMDTDYQDSGIFKAYGLAYELLKQGVPVDWVILPGKAQGDVDLVATVYTSVDGQPGDPTVSHGYRGGPFVVDSVYYAQALPIVQAWQSANPEVAVHKAVLAFTANAAREMTSAPTIAIFADGEEKIAFSYLNAAKIPMSNGDPWPADDKSREYTCPGDHCCPDCFNPSKIAGPTTTSHTDGSLFDANGIPRYCQFMSMHYKYDPDPTTETTEVVAETRHFLGFRTHFFAECQAVNAFEDNPNGHFLTTNGLVKADQPTAVDYYHSDDPFAQADGGFTTVKGSEPAYALGPGSLYYTNNVVMLAQEGATLGTRDLWMNGNMDNDPAEGKVSYLGGHKYEVDLPMSTHPKSQGTRYFLNALFEAPCATDGGQPSCSTAPSGPSSTTSATYVVNANYHNSGAGVASNPVLSLALPAGTAFVSASDGGVLSGNSVVWDLDSLGPGADGSPSVTVTFDAEGTYSFNTSLDFWVGLSHHQVTGGPLAVQYATVSLLRYGEVTSLSPLTPSNSEIFQSGYSAFQVEKPGFSSGDSFPNDSGDYLETSPPLIYYQLQGNSGNTLRVAKGDNKVVITY